MKMQYVLTSRKNSAFLPFCSNDVAYKPASLIFLLSDTNYPFLYCSRVSCMRNSSNPIVSKRAACRLQIDTYQVTLFKESSFDQHRFRRTLLVSSPWYCRTVRVESLVCLVGSRADARHDQRIVA